MNYMAIYGISDLHLSFNKPVTLYGINAEKDIDKPMEKFGWNKHYNQIRDCWLHEVKKTDTVLIPGDISWAMRLDVARYDFDWIHQLPGKKVMSPGNHCYFVQSKKKVREFLPCKMEWIDADFTVVEDKVVAATRGWNLPGDRIFNEEEDRRIYTRQVGRLHMALEQAHKQHPKLEKWVMLHYPPITKSATELGFIDVMKRYNVTLCVYGHLHGLGIKEAIQGNVDGIELRLVSCDSLNFKPLKLK